MPQLIFLILVLSAGWYLYRRFVADAERITAQRRQAEEEARTGANGTLVKDPETGEYRLKRDDA